jgi:hypothetical protein
VQDSEITHSRRGGDQVKQARRGPWRNENEERRCWKRLGEGHIKNNTPQKTLVITGTFFSSGRNSGGSVCQNYIICFWDVSLFVCRPLLPWPLQNEQLQHSLLLLTAVLPMLLGGRKFDVHY